MEENVEGPRSRMTQLANLRRDWTDEETAEYKRLMDELKAQG